MMDLKTALENITTVRPKYALDEVMCIRQHKEEAIPMLLQYVKKIADGIDDLPDDYDEHSYPMFLLAEFKVKSAFEYLIQYLELSYEKIDWLLGDVLTEDFGAILASVATIDDIDRIKTVVENEDLHDFHRSVALEALVVMYVEGVYPRQELFDYMGLLLKKYRNETSFNTLVVCDCMDVYASEHFDYIKQLFEEDMIDEDMMDIDDFYRETAGGGVNNSLSTLKSKRGRTFVTDTVKSMGWWACFNEPQPVKKKVGRNDPCPCGSGKKYKKCCLQ